MLFQSMNRMFVRPEGHLGEKGADLMEENGGPMARRAVAQLELKSDATAIEIGFGPGLGLEALALAAPLGLVIGVDPSSLMHRRAKARNAAAIQGKQMVLLEGTVEDLQVAAASCDGALAIDNLHFWPNCLAGLLEIRRVLRPEAPFVCAFTPPSGGRKSNLPELFKQAGFINVTVSDVPEGFTVTGFATK